MKISIISILVITTLTGCHKKIENSSASAVPISGSNGQACCSYFTETETEEPVLVWNEVDDHGESHVYYAVWDDENQTFYNPIKIENSKGVKLNPESMAKMVFKPNGDIVAVYEVDTKSEINPYSGEIRYVYSTDNGVSWSNPSPVHQDTSSHKGRGFFDVELLANGEVGVAWLDATYPDGGRPLHFAQTTPENQFENEIMVENLACECCRVALESDAFGNIHLVFRNIDKIAEYEHIRDFAYSVSRDDGLTFSTPVIVSDDGWEFVGCPHTGAGFAVAGKNLHMAWYTMGGGSGLYYTSSSNSGQTFSERELISEHGRTPQVAVSNNGRVGMVWRESSGSNIQHSDHDGHNQSASKSTIMLQIRDGHTSKNTYLLSDGNSEVSFPVIHNNGDNYLIAWTERVNEAKKIKYKVFEP